MKNKNLFRLRGSARWLITLIALLTLGVPQMWADGGIGYKGVKFTKNGTATGWYNIHNVSWSYYNSTYDCRSGQSGVTDFNNANLGTVTTLQLKAFVVIGWTNSSDYVAGRLQYRLYKQSASAPSYTNYNVGNYGSTSTSSSAANVLASSGNDRVVGNASLTTDIVTSSTPAGNYYLQLKGLGRMQWSNGSSYGSFNANDGSEVKATLVVPGFETTSTSNAYGSVNVGSNSSATISFTQHYGTALTTSNCALSGDNSSEFEVTGISETGVTVKFKPATAGSKSATLTITDANSKTCTITLTGTGTTPPGLTVVAGTGISAVTGSDNDISAGDKIAITATVATGYTWDRWTLSGSGTLSTFTATTKNQTVTVGTAAAMTLTASATEDMSSLSTSCHYDAGNPSYAAPTVSGSATTVGYATTRTITATAAGTGYTFAGWTLTNCTRTDGGAATATSITIRSNGDGAAATVVANYTEDLSSTWYVEGDASGPFLGWKADATTMLQKKSGYSTGNDVYWTTTVTAAQASPSDTQWEFKIYNSAGANETAQWYGWGTSTSYYWLTNENNSLTLSNSTNNVRFKPYLAGEYEFHFNTSTKVLTVTWPVINQVRISAASPTDATNTGNFDLADQGSNNWSVSRTLNAKTTYTFKIVYNSDWYGKNSTNLTRASNTASSLSTSGGNMTIKTDAAGSYTFTFNSSTKNLTVTYPTAYTITFDKGTGGSAITATGSASGSLSSGDYVASGENVTFTQTASSGYTFTGWYTTKDTGGSAVSGISTTDNVLDNVTANKTVYSRYSENMTTVSLVASPTGKGTFTSGGSPVTSVSAGKATKPSVTAVPATGYRVNTSATVWTKNNTNITLSSTTANPVTVTGCGTANTSSTLTATFTPITYTVKFNGNGNTGGSMSNQTGIAYDSETTLTANAFTRTGYTFQGWATSQARADAGTVDRANSAAHGNLSSTQGATVNLYAVWQANTYTISFSQSGTGYGSGGQTANKTATYDAAMPTTISLPTAATGYAFMGYYDVLSPLGTQYYDASGNSAHNWDKTSNTTLYAYFKKAEITGFTFSTGSSVVAPSTNMTVTATLSPTPQPTTHIDWRILHSNDNPLDDQPSFGTGITTNTFASPTTSGMYKMEATLRTGNVANAGTVLSTYTASFQVAGDHTVTLQYKCGDETIKASTTMTGKPLVWTSVTAPEIFGYTFSKWIPGDGISIRKGSTEDTVGVATTATIQIKAIYDGKLTAIYTQNSYIYFKNTLGWNSVRVNFYDDNYWGYNSDANKGTGNNGITNRNLAMTLVEGTTDIYYYDYGTAGITPTRYVSFTQESMDNYQYFYQASPNVAHVVYPSRYSDALTTDKATEGGFYAGTPMFVPLASQSAVAQNDSRAEYYNSGYWTKYTAGTGYHLEIYYSDGTTKIRDLDFTSSDELMPMKATVNLEAGQTYKFQVKRDGDVYYGNSGEMTYNNHGQSTAWEMTNSDFTMCRITTNAAGDYTFNLSYSGNSSTPPAYRLCIAVDYPIAGGDYRVIYKHTGQTNWKASAIVPKVNNGKDTVSFFIKPGATPYMKIQQASVNASTGAVTWSDYYSVPTDTLTALSGDKVYNACITMNASGGASVAKIEPYTGNYYIRTDCANSKWDNWRSDPDHLMTYSEYSIDHGGYSHYYCHWVKTDDRKNIKFTIANDYNPGLSDTLTRETASGDWANITYFVESNGDIKRNANVRFMWNQNTNAISRAYVDGAQEDGSRFLVISSTDGKIKNTDDSALSNNEVTFSDNENWIYEANVKAQPTAAYKLISTWGTSNVITQYFKGSSSSTETLIDGSGSDWYTIRLLYDFKTNRLVAAWVPTDATITSDNPINADVMFIREHQGDIAQLTFGSSGKISKIETAYGVMRFNKYTLANKDKSTHSPLGSPASIYERSLFFISFPFRVKLSEVFGFGTYGTHWAIQYYDGADRAARGHFAENGSFWKWMNRSTAYLEPNQGYLLAIDLDLLGEDADVWGPDSRSEQIELYFPSYGTMPDITNASVSQTIPEHTCTINWYESGKVPGPDTGNPKTSYNRTIFDSHWNVLSVPTYVNTSSVSFANTTWTAAAKRGPKFLYTWNADDNTISATTASGYTYHAMHAYMAQYSGGITWTASSGSPASVVARRTYADEPREIEFNLELQQSEKTMDRAFVVLSEDEEVSAGFKFGEDMTKEFNANKSAIYTFIPGIAAVAGNTLPMSNQTTVVPVGVDIIAEGEYIISLPEGTSGVGVTLIDNELQTRTNLALTDYAVTLPIGTYDERFVLEISPIEQTTTGVEAMNGANGDASLNGVCKKLIDGVLYIVKDGKVFDARGARIQ